MAQQIQTRLGWTNLKKIETIGHKLRRSYDWSMVFKATNHKSAGNRIPHFKIPGENWPQA